MSSIERGRKESTHDENVASRQQSRGGPDKLLRETLSSRSPYICDTVIRSRIQIEVDGLNAGAGFRVVATDGQNRNVGNAAAHGQERRAQMLRRRGEGAVWAPGGSTVSATLALVEGLTPTIGVLESETTNSIRRPFAEAGTLVMVRVEVVPFEMPSAGFPAGVSRPSRQSS